MDYYTHSLCRFLWFTPGVAEMREKKNAYWLVDAIASYMHPSGPVQMSRDGMFKDLHFWKLHPDGQGGAVLTAAVDSGVPPELTQKIEYTDFEFDEQEPYVLFCARQYDKDGNDIWVLYLPEEH